MSKQFCILEKTESIGVDWVVDDEGVLQCYFGVESDNLVLPDGIKKISGDWGGGTPKTVVLNEDLEEIGDYGLSFNFYCAIDEIRIPKSVKSIGKYGVGVFKKFICTVAQL